MPKPCGECEDEGGTCSRCGPLRLCQCHCYCCGSEWVECDTCANRTVLDDIDATSS